MAGRPITISILANAANAVRGLHRTADESEQLRRKVAELSAQVHRLDGQSARVHFDTKGFAQGTAQIVLAHVALDRLRKGLPDLSFGLTGVAQKVSLIGAAALAAVGGALPLAGALGGLGAVAAAAAGGIGLYAAVALPTLQDVTQGVKEYNTASHAFDRAQAIGDEKKMTKARADMASALGALTPTERAAAQQAINLNKAWSDLSKTQAPVMLGIMAAGARTLAGIVPKLTPAIDAMGKAVKDISSDAFAGLSKAVDPFVKLVTSQGVPSLRSMATILGNIAVTAGHFIVAFAPLGTKILTDLKPVSAALRNFNFAGLAGSAGKLLPLVENLLSSLSGAIGALVKAAAPLAGPLLLALTGVADALGAVFRGADIKGFVASIAAILPQLVPIITVVLNAFAAFANIIAAQLVPLVPKLLPLVQQIATVFVNVLTGLSPLLPSLLDLIGVLVSLLPVVYPLVVALREALVPVVGALGAALTAAMPAISAIVGAVMSLLPPISGLLAAILPVVAVLLSALVPVVQVLANVLGALMPIISTLVTALGGALAQVIQALAPVFASLMPIVVQIATVLGSILTQAIQSLAPVIAAILPVVGQLLTALGGAFLDTLKALQPVIGVVIGAVAQLVPPLMQVLSALIPIIPTVGSFVAMLIGQLVPAIQPLIPVIVQLATMLASLLSQAIIGLMPVVQQIVTALAQILPVVAPLLAPLATLAQVVLGALMTVLSPIIGLVVQLAQTFGASLMPILVPLLAAFQALMPALLPLVGVVGQIIVAVLPLVGALQPILGILIQITANAAQFVAAVLVKLLPVLIPIIAAMAEWAAVMGGVLAKAIGWIVQAIVWLAEKSTWLWDVLFGHSIFPDIMAGFQRFGQFVGDAITAVINTIGSIVGHIVNIGQNIVNGLINGITGAWHLVTDTVTKLVNIIPEGVRHALGIRSPSTVMASLGANIMTGLTAGMASQHAAVARQVGATADIITNGLSVSPTVDVTGLGRLSPTTGAAGAAGSATYQITLNVAPGADPAEVGRQTVRAIEAYETRTGRRRLAAA